MAAGTPSVDGPGRVQQISQVQYLEERTKGGSIAAVPGRTAVVSHLETQQTVPSVVVTTVADVAVEVEKWDIWVHTLIPVHSV